MTERQLEATRALRFDRAFKSGSIVEGERHRHLEFPAIQFGKPKRSERQTHERDDLRAVTVHELGRDALKGHPVGFGDNGVLVLELPSEQYERLIARLKLIGDQPVQFQGRLDANGDIEVLLINGEEVQRVPQDYGKSDVRDALKPPPGDFTEPEPVTKALRR